MRHNLTRRNPFSLFEEEMFNYPIRKYEPFRDIIVGFDIPKTDLVEKDDHYELKMDIPGFKKEEVSIDILDDLISISAKHEENKEEDEDGKKVLYERRSSSMSRSFRFPGLKKENVKASLNDGVLEVIIQKEKEEIAKPEKVEIE